MASTLRTCPGEALRTRTDDRETRLDRRLAETRLDRRLAKGPVDPRMRMRRCELLPRPDPLAGAGTRMWTLRATRVRGQ